jgi:glyoxylase-like metal-dependent hydrolase (beta-lactamase superfamily II)
MGREVTMSESKHVTRTLITCTLALTVWSTAPAQELPFTLTEVGANVWAAIGGPNPATASNAGFVIGDDGVVVIDTFASAAGAKQLLAEIRRRTKLPVRFVVNTHHHLDHVAGNAVFIEAGARAGASPRARLDQTGEPAAARHVWIRGAARPAYDGRGDRAAGDGM